METVVNAGATDGAVAGREKLMVAMEEEEVPEEERELQRRLAVLTVERRQKELWAEFDLARLNQQKQGRIEGEADQEGEQ